MTYCKWQVVPHISFHQFQWRHTVLYVVTPCCCRGTRFSLRDVRGPSSVLLARGSVWSLCHYAGPVCHGGIQRAPHLTCWLWSQRHNAEKQGSLPVPRSKGGNQMFHKQRMSVFYFILFIYRTYSLYGEVLRPWRRSRRSSLTLWTSLVTALHPTCRSQTGRSYHIISIPFFCVCHYRPLLWLYQSQNPTGWLEKYVNYW